MNMARQKAAAALLQRGTRFDHHYQHPLNLKHPLLSKLEETCNNPTTQFQQIHAHIITTGIFQGSVFAASRLLKTAVSSLVSQKMPNKEALIDLQMATLLFYQIPNPDIFCYNLIIKAHSKDSSNAAPTTLQNSITFYREILIFSRLHPNDYTFCFLLDSCCSSSSGDREEAATETAEALWVGRQLHAQLTKHGIESGLFVGTSLVNMYNKCGVFEDACQTFDEMPKRTSVSWGAMIDACATHNHLDKCFGLFAEMIWLGIELSNATLVGVLCTCSKVGRLAIGRAMHGFITVQGLTSNLTVTVGTSLVDMYAKCGDAAASEQVFTLMPEKSTASWNCMINGLAMNGKPASAVSLFAKMQKHGKSPTSATFVSVLNACTHAGLVEDGGRFFLLMKRNYGIVPSLKHYGCIMDMYGRAGRIKEALLVIRAMHLAPDLVIWVALFGACCYIPGQHCRRLMREVVRAQLLKLAPYDTWVYMLTSDDLNAWNTRNVSGHSYIMK